MFAYGHSLFFVIVGKLSLTQEEDETPPAADLVIYGTRESGVQVHLSSVFRICDYFFYPDTTIF